MVQNAGQGIAFRLEVVRKRGSCARTWGHGFSRFRRDGQRSRLRGGIRPPSGRFVKAVDGDGQGVAPRAAVIVGHGIGEGVGQRVPGIQVLHGGQGIVEDVRVGAVGIEGQGTVRARLGDLGREGKDVVWNAVVVRVMRGGERAGYQSLHVFRHVGRGRRHRGAVVDSVDGHGKGVGPGSTVGVRHRVGESVGQGLPFAQPLYCG